MHVWHSLQILAHAGWHEQPECSAAPTEGPFEDCHHEEGSEEPEMENAIAQGALWEGRRQPGLDMPRGRKLRSMRSLLLDPRAMPGKDLQHCQVCLLCLYLTSTIIVSPGHASAFLAVLQCAY